VLAEGEELGSNLLHVARVAGGPRESLGWSKAHCGRVKAVDPLPTLSPGERFDVDLVNQAGTSTIIHWHGQLPPWKQDGFPWPQTPPIPAGDTQSYDSKPAHDIQ
jgi:FtsP/CotA-like multicopper oxidase with cupredoxin domain